MTQPKLSRRRGRPHAGDEPDQSTLLQGALEAFAEKGYDGTSVRELARHLDVSHALLTARFGSKEKLWFAAMEHALANTRRTLRAIGESGDVDDLEALRHTVVELVLFSAACPHVGRIMNHEGATDSPRVRFVVEHFIDPLRPGIERRLARLVEAGRIRSVPYSTLHFLVGQGGGAPFTNPMEATLLGAPEHPDQETVRHHAETVADILIAGLTAPTSHPDADR